MTRISLGAALLSLALAATPAGADCFADYKAKQDNPLRLHYGVVEVSDAACGDPGRAVSEVAGRIGRDGWQLLNVLSVFGPEGLDQRKQSAGQYFLRY
jgi:hypothetical protein